MISGCAVTGISVRSVRLTVHSDLFIIVVLSHLLLAPVSRDGHDTVRVELAFVETSCDQLKWSDYTHVLAPLYIDLSKRELISVFLAQQLLALGWSDSVLRNYGRSTETLHTVCTSC